MHPARYQSGTANQAGASTRSATVTLGIAHSRPRRRKQRAIAGTERLDKHLFELPFDDPEHLLLGLIKKRQLVTLVDARRSSNRTSA
jgi:hypothetical protein